MSSFWGEPSGCPQLGLPIDMASSAAAAGGHYYGHLYDVFTAYAAFAAATAAASSHCEPPRAKKRKLDQSTTTTASSLVPSTSTSTTISSSTTSSSSTAASADTSRLIFDKRGHVTFRPYSDSLDSPRQTYYSLLEIHSPLSKSRSGLTGSLPTTKSHKGLSDLDYPEEKVPHQECTIGNLFPEVLSTIFEYLDVPAKGRAAQVRR